MKIFPSFHSCRCLFLISFATAILQFSNSSSQIIDATTYNTVNNNDSVTELRYPWFACVGSGSGDYFPFLKVAIESAFVLSTELFPIIIISLMTNITTPIWLNKLENSKMIMIIYHNLSFSSKIAKYYPEKSLKGAFLRLDIPLVIEEVSLRRPHQINLNLEFGLYTDCDVIFQGRFSLKDLGYPTKIMIGSEAKHNTIANSGVLIFNITYMREELPSLLDFADSKKWDFVAMDQGLIISYFGPNATRLPDNYNWKPYWGINHNAVIIHFHAYKPGKFAHCLADNEHNMTTAFRCGIKSYNNVITNTLLRKYVSNYSDISRSYRYYLSLYTNLSTNIQQRINTLK